MLRLHISTLIRSFLYLTLLFYSINLTRAETTEFSEEQLKWLNSDSEDPINQVNEGQLTFLLESESSILHSINQITILPSSLDDGWVKLRQCYRNLDALPEVDIEYRYHSMKNFHIESKKQIDSATKHEQTVTLKNIGNDAEICVQADVRIFYQNEDLSYSLVNGPFHRRFLDGFYPYHVSLEITYPENLISPIKTIPEAQPGMKIMNSNGKLSIDSRFEGILKTEIFFKTR